VGYTGARWPTPPTANHGSHAEAIEITFDPAQISYRDILEFFFQIHDRRQEPTGQRHGCELPLAIFYVDDEQRRVAEDTIADVEASGLWPGHVVTEVTPAGPFWEAEPSIRTTSSATPTDIRAISPPGLGSSPSEATPSPDHRRGAFRSEAPYSEVDPTSLGSERVGTAGPTRLRVLLSMW